MNYACRSNRPITTQKNLMHQSKLSQEAKEIRKFIESHIVSIYVDTLTGEANIEVKQA